MTFLAGLCLGLLFGVFLGVTGLLLAVSAEEPRP
jgi:hypothetical protein